MLAIVIDASTKPRFRRPELLLHPSIPLKLGGTNPRTILGKEWWDVVRREAYRENNYCCWACGVFQLDAEYSGKLDAHEAYNYDYEHYTAKLKEVVALCRPCHMFIHWRRIVYKARAKRIVLRGLKILAEVGLPLPEGQVRIARRFEWFWVEGVKYRGRVIFEPGAPFPIQEEVHMAALYSNEWKLVLEGVK